MNTRPKVLNVATLDIPDFTKMLAQKYDVLQPRQVLGDENISGIRALVTSGTDGASADLIDRLPDLEIIANVGVGYDAVAVTHAAEKHIHVTNTPDVLTEDVVDLAVTSMVWLTRKIAAIPGSKITPTLTGKTLGVLGLGRIGNEVAKRAVIMKMQVSYTNRKEIETPYCFVTSVTDLAYKSDVLIVTLSAGPDSRQLINEQVLNALGPKGILINVSRGSVVDQNALITALRNGTLGGAGLDVFEDEPHVPNELFHMEQVMLTPHVGSATVETRIAMAKLAISNLDAHFSGKPLLTEVPETTRR